MREDFNHRPTLRAYYAGHVVQGVLAADRHAPKRTSDGTQEDEAKSFAEYVFSISDALADKALNQ